VRVLAWKRPHSGVLTLRSGASGSVAIDAVVVGPAPPV
jgi:hypothetical protein